MKHSVGAVQFCLQEHTTLSAHGAKVPVLLQPALSDICSATLAQLKHCNNSACWSVTQALASLLAPTAAWVHLVTSMISVPQGIDLPAPSEDSPMPLLHASSVVHKPASTSHDGQVPLASLSPESRPDNRAALEERRSIEQTAHGSENTEPAQVGSSHLA